MLIFAPPALSVKVAVKTAEVPVPVAGVKLLTDSAGVAAPGTLHTPRTFQSELPLVTLRAAK